MGKVEMGSATDLVGVPAAGSVCCLLSAVVCRLSSAVCSLLSVVYDDLNPWGLDGVDYMGNGIINILAADHELGGKLDAVA